MTVNFNFFLTKLSGIDAYEKSIDYSGGHAWGHVFMACSKLEAMFNYLVKQACVNDKCTCVYVHALQSKYVILTAPFVSHH